MMVTLQAARRLLLARKLLIDTLTVNSLADTLTKKFKLYAPSSNVKIVVHRNSKIPDSPSGITLVGDPEVETSLISYLKEIGLLMQENLGRYGTEATPPLKSNTSVHGVRVSLDSYKLVVRILGL